MKYTIDIAGMNRDLPLCKVSDDLYIGAFVLFGDVEITVHCAKELLKRAPAYDYLLAPEAKAIPLLYEMARQHQDSRYFIARKGKKVYMPDAFEVSVRSITTQVLAALLENAASEQGARMTAMDNATRNAGDMIDRLTTVYNRSRQAAITKELIEIISGAEAL